MEKKDISQISSGLRNAYTKAIDAARKKNPGYAIELFKSVVQREPAFTDARSKLREQERLKAESTGAFARIMANIKSAFTVQKGRSKIKKNPLEAMNLAEDALALNLFNPGALHLLADASAEFGAPFIAVDTLEILDEVQKDNQTVLKKLAAAYEADGQGTQVLRVWQRIAALRPGDLEIEQQLRSAAALASMQEGNWEGEGDYQSRVKSKEESKALEQQDRIVRGEDDIAEVVAQLEQKISEGDESIDNRRRLAELYFRSERFDDSIATYNWITEKMGNLDPAIDKAIEKAEVGKFNFKINSLKNDGATEEEINALEQNKYNYRLERAVDRVNKYPNDTELRFSLAVVYWDGGHVDEALEQFQSAQKNPHHRLAAIVYMGRCFHAKGQTDLAVEQFEKAISEMPVMDKTKMAALYHLGIAYEASGDIDKAMGCFKDIYQANVNYMDVGERIKKFYDTREKAPEGK